MRCKYALACHIAWICKGTSERNTAVLPICRMCRVARDMVCHTAWILILPSIWIVAVCLNAYECICNFGNRLPSKYTTETKEFSRKRRHRNRNSQLRFSFQSSELYPIDLSVFFFYIFRNDIFRNVVHAYFTIFRSKNPLFVYFSPLNVKQIN